MTQEEVPEPALNPAPEVSAREAGLRYVSDKAPGYRRKRWGRRFTYLTPEGEHVKDEALRARSAALTIPPAWTKVWISMDPRGHLQSTGRDEAGEQVRSRRGPDLVGRAPFAC